jgi:hypothetical protein
MAEQPAKRIPDWLAIDVLVILVSLALDRDLDRSLIAGPGRRGIL